MYESSFGLTEAPFSISPDPRYLYMSERHQEAMAHLRYGIQEAGGFVQLTGEIGTGKTTICRCMLEQLPENVDVALILNPQISHSELLATLCDEMGVGYPLDATPKQLLDSLNERLMENFSQGRRTVLVIDEAQILTRAVLEQIRILTNLETTRQKLMQIILIGQPELNSTLSRPDLRQLAQRITAKYHLEPLRKRETAEYIKYRLAVAGCHRPVFTRAAARRVFKLSRGVPRLINVICDRALLGAYSSNTSGVSAPMVTRAGREVFGRQGVPRRRYWWWAGAFAVACALAAAMLRPQWLGLEPSLFQGRWWPQAAKQPEPSLSPETTAPAQSSMAGQAQPPRVAPLGISLGAEDSTVALASFLEDGGAMRSRPEALARLLDAWGRDAGTQSEWSCALVASAHGLRCLTERGGWQDLRRFDRVAALALEHGGEEVYVLLAGIGEESVSLSGVDNVRKVARRELDSRWRGEYLLLWRAPPRDVTSIAEHSEGVDVLWLRQTLSRVPHMEATDLDNAVFDAGLKRQIMTFQRSNGLHVDGEADIHTLIRLNSIVDPEVPTLRRGSSG